MTIPEDIIEKLKLKESGEQVGNAFMNNLRIFESELAKLKGLRFLECDMQGNPCNDITVYNKDTKAISTITPEFILDMSLELVIPMIKEL